MVCLSKLGKQDKRSESVQVGVQGPSSSSRLQRERSIALYLADSDVVGRDCPFEVFKIVCYCANRGKFESGPVQNGCSYCLPVPLFYARRNIPLFVRKRPGTIQR